MKQNLYTTQTFELRQQEKLREINKGRDLDIPRRASVAGKYQSKMLELEVWLHEQLFKLSKQKQYDENAKQQNLLVYAQACLKLGEQIPELVPVLNYYISTITSFKQEELQHRPPIMDTSLVELNVKIEELHDEIDRDTELFDKKTVEYKALLQSVQEKKIQLENLKQLLGFE